jgi:hypothetical protein
MAPFVGCWACAGALPYRLHRLWSHRVFLAKLDSWSIINFENGTEQVSSTKLDSWNIIIRSRKEESNRVKVGTVQIDTHRYVTAVHTIIVKSRSASRSVVTKSVPCNTSPPCGSYGPFLRQSRNNPTLRPPPTVSRH